MFPPAQDYKRLNAELDSPNTGGMGAYCPVSHVSVCDNIQCVKMIAVIFCRAISKKIAVILCRAISTLNVKLNNLDADINCFYLELRVFLL